MDFSVDRDICERKAEVSVRYDHEFGAQLCPNTGHILRPRLKKSCHHCATEGGIHFGGSPFNCQILAASPPRVPKFRTAVQLWIRTYFLDSHWACACRHSMIGTNKEHCFIRRECLSPAKQLWVTRPGSKGGARLGEGFVAGYLSHGASNAVFECRYGDRHQTARP
jgi:hypothetical protein